MAIGSHQSHNSQKDEWLTPPHIIESLGEFDLDPCSPINRPWDTAKNHYTIEDNGLEKKWNGRVWLNPPYDHLKMWNWFYKLSKHGNGIALLFARTETKGFFDFIWDKADSILFIKGRLYFYNVDGSKAKANSGGPSCLVAYGSQNSVALKYSNLQGKFITLNNG